MAFIKSVIKFLGVWGVINFACFASTAQQIADFRIETDVLTADSPQPIDQTVTIFKDGIAYDFSRETPHRILIVDSINNRIALLDSQRKVQTRLGLSELQGNMESARQQLLQSSGGPEKLQDAAESDYDAGSQMLSVGKRFMRYEAKLQKSQSPEVATQYSAFASASALVNAWQARGSTPPPFARLTLNDQLQRHQVIPTEITRTIFVGEKRSVVTSRIHLTYKLGMDEVKLVEQFVAMQVSFPSVSLAEYNNSGSKLNR